MPKQRVRSVTDGQIGFLVVEDGKKYVRLDRGTNVTSERRLVPYQEHAWLADKEPQLGPMAKARIYYDTIRALRLGRGEYSVPDWQQVYQTGVGRGWIEGPPASSDDLAKRICAALKRELDGA